ncbi:serine/threonine-protein kinase pim-3-like [Kryptolebias marmoratus]|uniref:serine/threonine-protein kinase pim-3-like n=1 Tax=Kryptolebias marmoratus TaxID=37003 RepID=UPI0018AC9C22|nr:serine/threonine-protein kinase pim-3-like [Kryptolebias marmoratus]
MKNDSTQNTTTCRTSAIKEESESDSEMILFNPVSSGSNRTVASKRKATHEDEPPRKRIRVSEEPGPSTQPDDRVKRTRKLKRKITDVGEGQRPAKKKRGLDLILIEEATSSSMDTDSTSNDMEDYYPSEGDKRKRKQKRKADDAEEPPNRKKAKRTEKKTNTEETQKADFMTKYQEQDSLGEGGCGSVFAGYRRADNLPVAIKHIPENNNLYCNQRDENGRRLSVEVAVMLRLEEKTTSSPGTSAPVSLLDWYDLRKELIIVMERPVPAEDLFSYKENNGGCLTEDEAKVILKQLIDAAMHLQRQSIFHRDIKIDNILIETGSEVPRIRLIDFGLSSIDEYETIFDDFIGTWAHVPPEWLFQDMYSAESTTVWQVGVVLYETLHKKNFKSTSFLKRKIRISNFLSKGKTHTCDKFAI